MLTVTRDSRFNSTAIESVDQQHGPVSMVDTLPGAGAASHAPVPVSHYLWIVRRHWWKIASFVAASVLITVAICARLVPLYEGTAWVDIDRQSPLGILGQEAARSSWNDTDQFLATQIKLIQSDSVLRPVVEKYDLRAVKDGDPRIERSSVALKDLSVTRPANTYLLAISYRSANPELAAQVANAVAQSYITHTYNLRLRSSLGVSAFMEKQLDEVKANMERSAAALAKFERDMNVINPEEKTTILSARLLQLNNEYTTAQADRVKKQAALELFRNPRVSDAALSSAQGEPLRKLRERANETRERFSQVQAQYGANHPEYKKAATQIAEVERSMQRTRVEIADRVDSEYREAVNRENMLRNEVAQTKVESDKLNARSFEYQQYKREAEANKRLYDELVHRIKEAGINASFQNSAIRLADAARPAIEPIFPKTRLSVIVVLILSALLGTGAAIASDMLDNTVRDSEEAARSLGTPVLGTLPTIRNWRRRMGSKAEPAVMRPALRRGVLGDDGQSTRFRESVRTLRSSILLADTERRLRTIMITSATPAEGKSTTAAHLAIAHAEQGKRTLLIDGDLRRPSIHRKFAFAIDGGLSSVISGEKQWREALFSPAEVPNLDILPAGPPSRRGCDVIGAALPGIIDDAARDYDLIVVDAPPLLGFAEPLQMATAVDGVLLVARAGETNRKAIRSVLQCLERVRATTLGLVLNEVHQGMSDSYQYYGSYGRYYRIEA